MTTVAWDGKTLAADTQCTMDGHLRGRINKLFRLNNGSIVGGAGRIDQIINAVSYLNRTSQKDKKDKEPEFDESSLILVTPERKVVLFSGSLVALPILDEFVAEGSGKEIALTAMRMGLTAEQAVQLAGEMDVFTSKEVTTLELEPQEKECKNKKKIQSSKPRARSRKR